MNNIYQKLEESRKLIRESNAKKDGTNEFSKYSYFTPENVEKFVAMVSEKTKISVLCNLKKDQFGYFQTLTLINLEDMTDSKLEFELRTELGEVKATNKTQQMGSTDTYSERYIKMKVFQIKDNNLDFDSQDNRKPVASNTKTGDDFDL